MNPLRDAITQLPSEALFMDRLSQAVALARRKNARVGLLRLQIEPAGGGDALTIALARRIQGELRSTDSVARLGEQGIFTVLLNEVDGRAAAQAVAEELMLALARPLSADGEEIQVSADYTLVIFPEDADDEHGLLRAAAD